MPNQDVEQDVRDLLDEADDDEMEGLGDAVSRVTKSLGIQECGGCKKRRKWLNEKVPFRRGAKKKRG